MGGHFLQGQVVDTGEIVEMKPGGDSLWIKAHDSKHFAKYVVPKGFIAADVTGLTMVDGFDDADCSYFKLAEHTQQEVSIPLKKVCKKVCSIGYVSSMIGDTVNFPLKAA
ncbi:riboflavin synthase-like [Mangifera indica]|uniref:riboflavin synthase-like n=1 Tax=Mangifera indica TaxID=29780 RepID=UPI001CF984BE|nr:riboflavin synthase-like [Mangifera indica]